MNYLTLILSIQMEEPISLKGVSLNYLTKFSGKNVIESVFSEDPLHKSDGHHSAVGNVSDCRYVSDCRSRGSEFDPGPVPYFRGD